MVNMRVLKFAYRNDAASKCISEAFDRVIVQEPVNFDRVELHLGHGGTSLSNGIAKLCVDSSSDIFKDHDSAVAETAVRFELFRLMIKKIYDVPRLTEDVLVGREMIKKGFSEDLARMLHAFVACQRVIDLESYIKINLPWIIFYADEFKAGFFRSMSEKRHNKRYDSIAKKFFAALQKDLQNNKNLNSVVKQEMKIRADNKI